MEISIVYLFISRKRNANVKKYKYKNTMKGFEDT